MRIKNRLSPYPILDDFGDDYVDSSFEVEFEVNPQFSEVYGKLTFNLNNEEINELINQRKASYVAHIECPSTCFRKILSSYDNEIEFKFNAADVSKVIEIRTFIVLTQDVNGFVSSKFHPDYHGETFNLMAHQIIAIGTAKNYNVQKDDTDLDSLPSILQIVKLKDTKKGTLSVNTDSDSHIIIGLAEDVFELYARLGKSTFKSTVFSLVLLPALVIVIQRMYINREDETYTSMHWYEVIESMLNNNGFKIEELSIENDSLLAVCQSIFADPIARSFKELDFLVKGCDFMNLMYLSKEAIDDIKVNYKKYKRHFQDDTNEWFLDLFQKNNWLHESKIQYKDIKFNYDIDYNVSDRKNVEIVYEAMRELSPSLATDERVWSGMLFCYFWNFVKYRRAEEIKSGVERDVLNSFFFMRGTKRSCFMNCLSRLWWTGYLLYDDKNSNHYKAVDLICENAYSSNIILLSSNNFVANKDLALGVLDCIAARKESGEKIGRYHFVEANKYINCIGGTCLLDTLTRKEVRDLVNKRLNKLYTEIVLN